MGYKIKILLAYVLDFFHILDKKIEKLGKKYSNKYIRIVNYHDVKRTDINNFEKQLKYYKLHFSNINYQQFVDFIETGNLPEEKPGLMLTFDDGLKGNYLYGVKLLEKYNMTGYFFVPSDLIGEKNQMSYEDLKDLIIRGHFIGCHTATHHRMNKSDTNVILKYEIEQSKKSLEKCLNVPVEIFCWCGGEEEYYTKEASDIIKKSGYKFGFMTNSLPVTQGNHPFQIQRINVEAGWKVSVMKFQISGLMDRRFKKKRERVNRLTE